MCCFMLQVLEMRETPLLQLVNRRRLQVIASCADYLQQGHNDLA